MGGGASQPTSNKDDLVSPSKRKRLDDTKEDRSGLVDLGDKLCQNEATLNVASQGKLKKLALGQAGYFDQQRDYDSTLAKVDLNHTAQVEWSQPSTDAPGKAQTKFTPKAGDGKNTNNGGTSGPNGSQNIRKAPPPPRGVTPPPPRGAPIVTGNNSSRPPSLQASPNLVSPHVGGHAPPRPLINISHTPHGNPASRPQSSHISIVTSPSVVGSADQPSFPQERNSPPHNESFNLNTNSGVTYNSKNQFNNNSNYNINNTNSSSNNNISYKVNNNASNGSINFTSGSAANSSNRDMSGLNPTHSNSTHNGLQVRPFPRGDFAPGAQQQGANTPAHPYYTEDDDMIGIFGTMTVPQKEQNLKRPDNVPQLSIQQPTSNSSSNHNMSNHKIKSSVPHSGKTPNPPTNGEKLLSSSSTPNQINRDVVSPPVLSHVPKVSYAHTPTQQGVGGPKAPPTLVLSHTPVVNNNVNNTSAFNAQSYANATIGANVLPNGRPSAGHPLPKVKETTDINRTRAVLPTDTAHTKPTSGNWLSKRYIVNNYILLDILGTGSYGEVRLCKDKGSDKLFAIKIISKDFLKKKKAGKNAETYFEDIKREIAIMKKLNHPNVLRLFEVLDDPNVNKMYLVLEYMKKGDLINILKTRSDATKATTSDTATKTTDGGTGFSPLHDFDIWDIFKQVVAGVRYLHFQNIVHGDIKPQNLLLDDNGVVKIADFGISQMLSQSSQQIGDAAGTPAFMSPELCEGKSFSGQLADIWAIGATIFMLRFGNPPFVAKSIINLYFKIVNDPLVFPFDIDPGLRNLLENMLEKDPTHRYTMKEIMQHPWLRKRPLPPLPPRPSINREHDSKPNTAKDNKRGQTPNASGAAANKQRSSSPGTVAADSLKIDTSPYGLSFQPPESYDAEEAAASNAPKNTIDNSEIFMSVGDIRKRVKSKGGSAGTDLIEEDGEGSDDENLLEETRGMQSNGVDLMNTNWGEDVFEMVDDGENSSVDDGGDDDDDTVDDDSVISKKMGSISKNTRSSKKLPTKLNKKEDNKAIAVDKTHGSGTSKDNSESELAGAQSTQSSLGGSDAMNSLGGSEKPQANKEMTQEEEEQRAKRFVKTSVAKRSVLNNNSNSSAQNTLTSGSSSEHGSKSTLGSMYKAGDKGAASEGNASTSQKMNTPLQNLQNKGIKSFSSKNTQQQQQQNPQPSPSSKSPSKLRPVHQISTASLAMDEDETLDQLSMEEFSNMMDTLAMQPRLNKNKLTLEEGDSEEEEGEKSPAYCKSSINIDGVESQLFNNFNCVAAAFHSEQGLRHTQEDRCVLLPNVGKMRALEGYGFAAETLETLNKFSMACVFDGHSGWRTSQYLSQHFPGLLVTSEKFLDPKQFEFAIIDTCKEIDEQICTMLRSEEDSSGSTGVIAVYDGRKNRFTVASVGDSMCVLSRGGRAVMLNKMHRLIDNDLERDRVRKAGGTVINNRVNGVLAVSRAFGDTQFKEYVDDKSRQVIQNGIVISQPDIYSEIITPKTEFGIIATDGLWDVMSPQVAVSFVMSKLSKDKDLQKAAKELTLEALARGSVDNVTVLVLTFHTTVNDSSSS